VPASLGARPGALLAALAVAAGAPAASACRRGDDGARSREADPPRRAAEERERMVREQLERRGIRDARVLAAMGSVPRDRFVPEDERESAHDDRPLPIGHGQTISQPYIVAFMIEALGLEGEERVLEVGSGSGYAAAVLSRVAREVHGIEIERALLERSVATVAALGYENVHLRHGDGFHGWPEKAPFDAIVMSFAAEGIPEPLWEQLRPGGRLVYPKGPPHGIQELVVVTKEADGARKEQRLAPVRFVPMRRGDPPRRPATPRRRASGARARRRSAGTTAAP
jgi:protein-L-isoaspartate(D-aspartate) O-methyltransferase